jgi:thioredoxin-dependent peroxiredoxin
LTIRLGQLAPNFDQDTANGGIRFYDWIGSSWAVLFSYHRAFDPVCSAELAEVARLKPEWDGRNVRIVGLSADTAAQHLAWEARIANPPAGRAMDGPALNFPVVVDTDGSVSGLYGLIHPESSPVVTTRSLFVVDPQKKVRLIQVYPPDTARNFIEILRVIDNLQQSGRQRSAKPAAPRKRPARSSARNTPSTSSTRSRPRG